MSECVTRLVFESNVVSPGALHQWITECSPAAVQQIMRGWSMRHQASCFRDCSQMSSELRSYHWQHSLACIYSCWVVTWRDFDDACCITSWLIPVTLHWEIFATSSTNKPLRISQETLQRINKMKMFPFEKPREQRLQEALYCMFVWDIDDRN